MATVKENQIEKKKTKRKELDGKCKIGLQIQQWW